MASSSTTTSPAKTLSVVAPEETTKASSTKTLPKFYKGLLYATMSFINEYIPEDQQAELYKKIPLFDSTVEEQVKYFDEHCDLKKVHVELYKPLLKEHKKQVKEANKPVKEKKPRAPRKKKTDIDSTVEGASGTPVAEPEAKEKKEKKPKAPRKKKTETDSTAPITTEVTAESEAEATTTTVAEPDAKEKKEKKPKAPRKKKADAPATTTEQIVSESNEIQPDSNGLFDSIPNDGFEYQSMTLNGKIKYIRKKKSEDSNNELHFEELEK